MTRAQALLLAAGEVYTAMKTYQDKGVVIDRDRSGDTSCRTVFSTCFMRPSLFQFYFESPHPYPPLAHQMRRNICGMDEDSTYLWSTDYSGGNRRIEEIVSLDMAIAGATGISGGSAFTIYQLLFKGALDWHNRLIDLVRRDDEDVDGVRCSVLSGRLKHAANIKEIFYFEQESLLLRKQVTFFPKFRSEEIRSDIRVNEPIPAEAFARPNVD
jgi:hypothetical protein